MTDGQGKDREVNLPRTPDIGEKGRIQKRPIPSGLVNQGNDGSSGLRSGLSTKSLAPVRIGIRPLYHALVEGRSEYIFNLTNGTILIWLFFLVLRKGHPNKMLPSSHYLKLLDIFGRDFNKLSLVFFYGRLQEKEEIMWRQQCELLCL